MKAIIRCNLTSQAALCQLLWLTSHRFQLLNIIKVYFIFLACQCLSIKPPLSCICHRNLGSSWSPGKRNGVQLGFVVKLGSGVPTSAHIPLIRRQSRGPNPNAREMGQCDPVCPGRTKRNRISYYCDDPRQRVPLVLATEGWSKRSMEPCFCSLLINTYLCSPRDQEAC